MCLWCSFLRLHTFGKTWKKNKIWSCREHDICKSGCSKIAKWTSKTTFVWKNIITANLPAKLGLWICGCAPAKKTHSRARRPLRVSMTFTCRRKKKPYSEIKIKRHSSPRRNMLRTSWAPRPSPPHVFGSVLENQRPAAVCPRRDPERAEDQSAR